MKTEATKKAGKVRITAKAVTSPELYRYLKRHRLCIKYIQNINTQHPESLRLRAEGILQPLSNIKQSFTWYETPQGHDFWKKHDKTLTSGSVS